LDGLETVLRVSSTDILSFDDALSRLEALAPRQKEIVELRVFAGLSHSEIAEVLKVSTRTVDREWMMARAWLQREFSR
ncbi:MAG: sigma-70 family RNA polymerase sigma factor, partial [Blastocatellia bacterium]|nr:sigma-70 family RNA polymerase sigma factor [Blastocatellia bacterium]